MTKEKILPVWYGGGRGNSRNVTYNVGHLTRAGSYFLNVSIMSNKEKQKLSELLNSKGLDCPKIQALALLIERIESQKPMSVGDEEIKDTTAQLYTINSLLKTSVMALYGMFELFGSFPINSREPHCSIIDIAETLEVAANLMPYEQMENYESIRILTQDI